jgi:hypothetical protein
MSREIFWSKYSSNEAQRERRRFGDSKVRDPVSFEVEGLGRMQGLKKLPKV